MTTPSNCAINHGCSIYVITWCNFMWMIEEKRLEIDKQKLIPFAIIGLAAILALLPAILNV